MRLFVGSSFLEHVLNIVVIRNEMVKHDVGKWICLIMFMM